MKEKILETLKTKYKTLGLSDKSFDGVAEFLSKTITEESEIDAAVTSAELIVKSVQGEADRVRLDSTNKLKELQKENEQLKVTKPITKPDATGGDEGNEDMPAWAKAMKESLEGLESQKQQQAQLQQTVDLKGKAKELMLKNEIDNSLCDDILSDISISDTDTPEMIAEKGVDKYNYFKTKFAPESGLPNSTQGVADSSNLDDMFKGKTADFEQAAKSLENVNIK